MITNKAMRVARWEFMERIRTKSFIIGLFLTPAIMALFFVVPTLLGGAISKQEPVTLAVYDGTGRLMDSIRTVFERSFRLESGKPMYRIDVVEGTLSPSAAEKFVDERIVADKLEAALLIPPEAFDSLSIDYRSKNVSDIERAARMEQTLSDIIAGYKLSHAGLDPKKVRELNRRASLRTVRVSSEGEKESGFLESFGISYVFLIMLMIMVLGSGQMLVRSMVEEKSNRIVEILVSSCSPVDLMFGKIIGLSMLGLVQVLFWAVISVTLVLATKLTGLPLENLWLMIAYFLLGFLLYASIFVTFGCLASTEQEAQQMTSYLSILLSLPLVVAILVAQNPNSPLLTALTLFPLLTPSMMILRLPVLTPPLWEIAVSLVLLVGGIVAMIWIASKVFRIGILLTGKRPSLDEIVRWIRS
jgi:ABC-2 type transport system permease protein